MKTKLVIFGITGDLASRYLLPALSRIIGTGDFDDLTIIGVSRRHVENFEVLGDHDEQLGGTTSMFEMDLSNVADYEKLRGYINLHDDEQVLFYLAVPPASSAEIVENLGRAGLNSPNYKLLLEKPFGTDLVSAKDLISHVAQYFDESQIYRIDHYLAKEMAQNVVIFRASNAIFSNIWDNRFIESVQVIVSEQIGIEGRAHFYEQTGALRDVLQGHVMQLLSLILLHVPDDLDWGKLPAARLQALTQLRPVDPSQSLRAQYENYRQEVGNADSQTETFVALTLHSDDPAWQNVPLQLVTGKALDKRTTEVRVHFHPVNAPLGSCLIFHIQPDEGIEIDLITKKPGYDQEFETQKLQFMYPDDVEIPNAYEQVIVDAIRTHKSLFTSGDEVVRAWEILAPLQQAWQSDTCKLAVYKQGSAAADVLKANT